MKTRETMSYKINSIRIPEYDYSAENYFVTICSFKKEKIFSEIKNGNIYLTEIGKIIKEEILNTENIRQNIIIIDDYVIMPNHIHFILIIDNNLFFANVDVRTTTKSTTKNVGVGFSDPRGKINYTNKGGKTPPLPTLGDIIGYFKYQTTKEYNKMHNKGFNKLWQRNYYEHIIRNDKKLYEIRTYIQNNPLKWNLDEYYK